MVIDSHTHFGSILDFDLPEELLIRLMSDNDIKGTVVSNIEGIEFDHNHQILPANKIHSQMEVNLKAIKFGQKYPKKIFPLLWAMPHTGGVTKEFEKLIEDNRKDVYGIKVHPYLNNVDFDSSLVEPYIKIAKKYNLPVVSHTASTNESSPLKVAFMANKYPEVKFLMVHMGLYTDNEESINLILSKPNLYGDTTWVKPESTLNLIRRGGIKKIMFGTDAPIGGKNSYSDPIVKSYLEDFEKLLGAKDYLKFMSGNAKRFFGI